MIHQPSWETFCLFDDLILLAKGGLTAYYGPQEEVQVCGRRVVDALGNHKDSCRAFNVAQCV